VSAGDMAPRSAQPLLLNGSSARRAVLWAFVACGASASLEPSPYEFMFVAAALVFGWRGLLFDRAMIPLVVWLALFNAGGLLSLTPFVDDSKSVIFIVISLYIALSALFFAALVAQEPLERMRTIRSGYVMAAFAAAILGVLGYFDVAGLGVHFTLYDNARASGPFKDPNVFGPFLVPAIVWLTQDILLRRAGLWRTTIPLLTMLLALLLSFSRGAWGACAGSIALLLLLTFSTTRSAGLRQRIAVMTILGLVVLAVLLAIVLSIPEIRDMFEVRASLNQYYDVGELGRFGAQWRSIPLLLDRPFGFGPLRFRTIFPAGEDPHEVYINAFASYGWLGGLSFAAFTVTTFYVGWRLVFQRTPYQTEAIAVWSCLFAQMMQGFQIDTDHWRHLYLLFGALYGLSAGSRINLARRRDDVRPAADMRSVRSSAQAHDIA
jgi:O-Antigen ligase